MLIDDENVCEEEFLNIRYFQLYQISLNMDKKSEGDQNEQRHATYLK